MDVRVGVLEGSVVGLSGLGGVLGERFGGSWGPGAHFGSVLRALGSVLGGPGRLRVAFQGVSGASGRRLGARRMPESQKQALLRDGRPTFDEKGFPKKRPGRQRDAQGSQERPKRGSERALDATRGESENVPNQ